MSNFKIVLANPSIYAYLSYRSFSEWRTRFATSIISIDYTGENAILIRRPHIQEYTYTYNSATYTATYKFFQYYLIGKNVTIDSIKMKSVYGQNVYGTNYSNSFNYAAIPTYQKQSAQNNVIFDINWLLDTSDYTTISQSRDDATILTSIVPIDNLTSVPSSHSLTTNNCVLGLPERYFSTQIYAVSPTIFNLLSTTHSGAFFGRNYTSASAYDQYTFYGKPNESVPSLFSDFRYAPISADARENHDNFLFERNGDVKYNLLLSSEQNYLTEWNLIEHATDGYLDEQRTFDIFGYSSSGGSTSGVFYNPNHYSITFKGSLRNGYTPPDSFSTMESLAAGFPSFKFGIDYAPYENALVLGVPVSDLVDESNNYVQTGNLPSDAIYNETDEDGIPTSWSGKDPSPQGENGTQNISVDDMELPSPTRGALTAGACRYYLMTKEAMETFLHWFWYENHGLEDVFDNFWTNMYGNLKETILSYQYFPCTTSALGTISSTQENILLGRLVSTQTASRLNGLPSTILLGTIDIKKAYRHFNTFVDWEGYTNFQIYLPFAGIVKLPTKSVQNAILKVYYCVDVGTGQMNYIIKSYPNGGENGFVVLETTTPIGETIPISLMDDMENKTKLAQTAVQVVGSTIGLAASVATGNIAGAAIATGGLVSSTANASNPTNANVMIRTAEHSGQRMISGVGQIANEAMQYQSDTPSAVGQITGLMGKWSPLKCYLIIDYPTVDNKSNGYNRHVGYLNYKPYKLSSLSGFTTCVKPQIDFTNTAPLLKEIEELYQLMESGIIL